MRIVRISKPFDTCIKTGLSSNLSCQMWTWSYLKANMDIAFEYAQLCEEEEVRNIYQIILHEWQLTKDIILMIENKTSCSRRTLI